jgi:excisionase family DNA binding protein
MVQCPQLHRYAVQMNMKDSIMARKPRNRRERRHPEWVSLQEAADYCGVDYRTIRRWIAAGHLNATRVGPKLIKVDVVE